MEITTTTTGDVQVVAISGEVDGKTAPEVQAHLGPLLQPGSKILLDMHRVDYLSSAGLRVLLSAYRQLAPIGGRLGLAGLSEDIAETLRTTGLLRFFGVYETLDAGLAALA